MGKSKFSPVEVAGVHGDNGIGTSGNGKFNKVVVPFVGEIRTPQVIHLDPLTYREEGGKQPPPLLAWKRAFRERFGTIKEFFIFMKKRCSDERSGNALQASPQHLAIAALGSAQKGAHENVGIDNDTPTHCQNDSIYAINRSNEKNAEEDLSVAERDDKRGDPESRFQPR